jgi:hypothetical protein
VEPGFKVKGQIVGLLDEWDPKNPRVPMDMIKKKLVIGSSRPYERVPVCVGYMVEVSPWIKRQRGLQWKSSELSQPLA